MALRPFEEDPTAGRLDWSSMGTMEELILWLLPSKPGNGNTIAVWEMEP